MVWSCPCMLQGPLCLIPRAWVTRAFPPHPLRVQTARPSTLTSPQACPISHDPFLAGCSPAYPSLPQPLPSLPGPPKPQAVPSLAPSPDLWIPQHSSPCRAERSWGWSEPGPPTRPDLLSASVSHLCSPCPAGLLCLAFVIAFLCHSLPDSDRGSGAAGPGPRAGGRGQGNGTRDGHRLCAVGPQELMG